MFKPVFALYIGAALIVVALIGAGSAYFGPEKPHPAKQQTAKQRARPMPQVSSKEPAVAERDLAAEEAELTRILLAQIKESPDVVDEAWLASFCRYIPDEDALAGYLNQILDLGARRDISYKEERLRARQLPVRDPRFFIEQGKQNLYISKVNARILDKARGFLALGLYRAYNADAENKGLGDDFAYSFFKENIKLHESFRSLALEAGDEDPRWLEAMVKAREAAIVDRFYRIKHRHAQARKDYEGSGSSAALVLNQTDVWRKTVHENLLALGRVYADLAANETLYKSRQRDYSDRAFKSLAMVYQVSYSGEALTLLRQVNKIERYNQWQLAHAHWKKAQLAADNGRVEDADRLYFAAVRHYLQCLARLEGQRREVVTQEYRRLKRDIAAWNARKVDLASEGSEQAPAAVEESEATVQG